MRNSFAVLREPSSVEIVSVKGSQEGGPHNQCILQVTRTELATLVNARHRRCRWSVPSPVPVALAQCQQVQSGSMVVVQEFASMGRASVAYHSDRRHDRAIANRRVDRC